MEPHNGVTRECTQPKVYSLWDYFQFQDQLTTHTRVKPYCQVYGNTFNALSCLDCNECVQQLCCTDCCHFNIHTWNHTTVKTSSSSPFHQDRRSDGSCMEVPSSFLCLYDSKTAFPFSIFLFFSVKVHLVYNGHLYNVNFTVKLKTNEN